MMTRKSIFGTTRPDLGTLIRFNTPGENETCLDEDAFERQVDDYFSKYSCLSDKRITRMAAILFSSGDIIDGLKSIDRAHTLMELLPLENPQYKKMPRGYVKLD